MYQPRTAIVVEWARVCVFLVYVCVKVCMCVSICICVYCVCMDVNVWICFPCITYLSWFVYLLFNGDAELVDFMLDHALHARLPEPKVCDK